MDLKIQANVARRSIDAVRTLAMDAVQKAGNGHPGTAMALAPLAYTIFTRFLRHNPANPQWHDRDRFILSAGHASILHYSLLHLTGYDLPMEQIKRFRQSGSITPGHPEHFLTPGIETTTGPLGQGFANGIGFGMAERFLAERYNRIGHEVVNHRTFAICSDGDLMEGVSNEAASLAGQNALGKLVYFYDDNRITIDGTTAISFDREDKAKRFEAQGWHVLQVSDSEDLEALSEATEQAIAEEERPSLVIVRSHIAYPAPNAMDTAAAHGAALGEDEVRAAKEAMGLDPDESFIVPDEVYEHMDQKARGRELEENWNGRFSAWRSEFPELGEEWDRAWSGQPEPGYEEQLPKWDPAETEKMATRKAGGAAMDAFKNHTPTMIGGAADLVGSTNTVFSSGGVFSPANAGRNIAWGIREHAMGSAVNGIALHGGMVRPYGSTFLIFSDYMRPAVRLSALMGIKVAWIWTHDSVGLGEDGPTHQPVEHYMSLRMIPNLTVIRPADANETSMAWRSEFPELGEEWDRAWSGQPEPGYEEQLPKWDPAETEKMATRKAGGAAMDAFKNHAPTMIGGAADLVGSTNTVFSSGGVFSPANAGRNIAWGIREHAMGSAVNGIALHGGMVRPYGSTFLIFSDYMRPAVRLSALMGIKVAWIWTHDSVGLGEDGPTHQPVEHYMALRMIPNLTVIRPADANETSMAWRSVFETDGPVALLLTRQNVPVLDPGPAEGALKGAYVREDADGDADVILIASGSEVAVALEARKLLADRGVDARVVSMPSWEIYDAQDQAYKDSVLPPSVEARVSVEAGVPTGWERYVGFRGRSVGINRYGASTPGEELLAELGISPENVANEALDLLGRPERIEEDQSDTPAVSDTDSSEGHS